MVRIAIALGSARSDASDRTLMLAPPAASWPFLYPLDLEFRDGPIELHVPNIHEAFVNQQTSGTRLVTTQATYLMLAWQQAVGDRDVLLTATADQHALERYAPEVLARKGPFMRATIAALEAPDATQARVGLEASAAAPTASGTVDRDLPTAAGGSDGGPEAPALARAFRASDPGERLTLCVQALDVARRPAALVATASVCMEVNDLEAAARDLDEALTKAPDWPAAYFERGKLWLRLDDMERAADCFREAATRMPRFASAWSNLGATLGELDRQTEALEAFRHALECDPDSPQTHNNIGVLSRELGDLAQSEAAFGRVLELAPDMAFGYYNLGHTLFLQGRYQAALGAYAEGQRRDPERNPVQASRLAMCRLATGDPSGAVAELQRATTALPREYRQQLLADTHSIAWALLTHRPDLPGWQQVHEWLALEQTR